MSKDRPRQWLTLEAAAAELDTDAATVQTMIRAGRLQCKRDSFGARVVSAVSIQAFAGKTYFRGVR